MVAIPTDAPAPILFPCSQQQQRQQELLVFLFHAISGIHGQQMLTLDHLQTNRAKPSDGASSERKAERSSSMDRTTNSRKGRTCEHSHAPSDTYRTQRRTAYQHILFTRRKMFLKKRKNGFKTRLRKVSQPFSHRFVDCRFDSTTGIRAGELRCLDKAT